MSPVDALTCWDITMTPVETDPRDFLYVTTDPLDYLYAKKAIEDNRSITLGNTYGRVRRITPRDHRDSGSTESSWEIIIEPYRPLGKRPGRHDDFDFTTLTSPPCNQGEIVLPINKEHSMKVFETIVVKLNEQDQPESIAQGITLVTAKTAQAAKDQVLVDYASANKISGKDLTGFQVRVREFCV